VPCDTQSWLLQNFLSLGVWRQWGCEGRMPRFYFFESRTMEWAMPRHNQHSRGLNLRQWHGSLLQHPVSLSQNRCHVNNWVFQDIGPIYSSAGACPHPSFGSDFGWSNVFAWRVEHVSFLLLFDFSALFQNSITSAPIPSTQFFVRGNQLCVPNLSSVTARKWVLFDHPNG